MSRDILDTITSFSYGEYVKLSITDGDLFNAIPKNYRKKLLTHFEGFLHEEYGTCWTLDLEKYDLSHAVDPRPLKIKLKVSA